MTKKNTHGGKRKGAGRKKTKMPARERKVPLVLSVKQKTKQKVVKDYGLKGFAAWLDEEMEGEE